MFVLREKNRKGVNTVRRDLAIIPVSDLAEAATMLAKIGGHLITKPVDLDEFDSDECYEVEFTLDSVIKSGAWKEEDLGETATVRRMKIDGTAIEIDFNKSDNQVELEYFLVVILPLP